MSINQVGILFNFLAGFLLAPDIFGEEKLIKWERNLRNMLRTFEGRLFTIYRKFNSGEDEKPRYSFHALFSTIAITCLVTLPLILWSNPAGLFIEYQSMTIFLQTILSNSRPEAFTLFVPIFITLPISIFYVAIREINGNRKGKAQVNVLYLSSLLFLFLLSILSIFNISLSSIILLLFATPFTAYSILLFLPDLFIGLSGMVVESMIISLSKKRGLRGTFTVLGVASFVLGNILQFLAG